MLFKNKWFPVAALSYTLARSEPCPAFLALPPAASCKQNTERMHQKGVKILSYHPPSRVAPHVRPNKRKAKLAWYMKRLLMFGLPLGRTGDICLQSGKWKIHFASRCAHQSGSYITCKVLRLMFCDRSCHRKLIMLPNLHIPESCAVWISQRAPTVPLPDLH